MNDPSRLTRSFVNSTAMFVLTFMVIHINNQFLRAFIAIVMAVPAISLLLARAGQLIYLLKNFLN